MKVIVDTNILVSAILRGGIPKKVIQFLTDSSEFSWVISDVILAEYKSVLVRPKFKLTQEVILEWWEILETIPRLIEVNKVVNFPRDSKDAKFLACALVSKADFLITGDTDFSEVENLGNTKIISASEFKYLVIDPISDEKNRLSS